MIYMNTCGTFILVKGHTNPSITQPRMIIIIGEKSYRSDSTFMGTLQCTTKSSNLADLVVGSGRKIPIYGSSQLLSGGKRLQKRRYPVKV